MSFIWPWMLAALLFVPFLLLAYQRLQQRRRAAQLALGPLGFVQTDDGRPTTWPNTIVPLLFLIGITLLIFSLARPEMFVSLPRIEGTVILAFDVSNSMAADDLLPTRIDAAKEAARAFVESQPETIRIGVVAFSDGGLVVQPPTNDDAAVLSTIDRLSPQGATSLAQGIFASLNAIAGKAIDIGESTAEEPLDAIDIGNYSSAVVVLLSDGENTESTDPLEVAQLAAESGVRIYPVGIGSVEGAELEIDGFTILTRLDEEALKAIAATTNGAYFSAGDEESLRDVYENIDLQLTVDGEKAEVTSLLAGLALAFLSAGGVLSLLWFGRAP